MLEYFTLEEFRELPLMDDSDRYSDDAIEVAAGYIVGVLEREVGTSFVPRTRTAHLDPTGPGSAVLSLPDAHVVDVTSVTAAGVTVDVTTLRLHDGGMVSRVDGSAWPTSHRRGDIDVVYRAGYSVEPPGDVKGAVMAGTRWRLLATASSSDVSARQTSMTNEQAGTISFVVAGRDRPTGYPDVDAVITGWRDQLDGYGFA